MTAKEYSEYCRSQSSKHYFSFVLALIIIVISLYIFSSGYYLLPRYAYAATNPSLGFAANFGILASTYTNTTSGTTITGDLGYTTSPVVAPIVSGSTNVADGTYNTAGTNQGSALADLNSQACTHTFPAGAVDLAIDTSHGTLGIYAPGVYCTTTGSAASIGTSGVTLSGSGTYIFKIDGAFTTNANSVVTLDNGASSCDVFWAPTSATTLGANSTFVGTDIDAAGITIGSTVNWKGRALAYGGTVSTDVDTISTTCAVAPTPTPTVTTTPTPTATPTAEPTTSSTSTTSTTSTSSTGTSVAPCPAVDTGVVPPVVTESKRINSNSVYISWGPFSGTDKFNIRYGPMDGNWLYSANATGFSTTISSLPTNQPVWVQVAARNECQVGSYGKSYFLGKTITSTGSPGFPNTGNPLLPNTGFGTRPRQ